VCLASIAWPGSPCAQEQAAQYGQAAAASVYADAEQPLVVVDFLKDEPHVQSFNGKGRDELLNEHWFASTYEVQNLREALHIDFSTVRPHGSWKTPEKFVKPLAGPPAAPAHPHRSQADVRGSVGNNEGGS
jgi:hypothetical protein